MIYYTDTYISVNAFNFFFCKKPLCLRIYICCPAISAGLTDSAITIIPHSKNNYYRTEPKKTISFETLPLKQILKQQKEFKYASRGLYYFQKNFRHQSKQKQEMTFIISCQTLIYCAGYIFL